MQYCWYNLHAVPDRNFLPNRTEAIPSSSQSYQIGGVSNNTASSTAITPGFISSNSLHELDVEQSFRVVLKWTENVIHGLQEMQWVPIGFPSQPPPSSLNNSKIDWNKPYYQMNNPNLLIEKLLTEYSNQVYNALSVLVKKRESFPHNSNTVHSSLKQQTNNQANHGSTLHNSQNHSTSSIQLSSNPSYSTHSSVNDSGKKRMIGKGRNHAAGAHGSYSTSPPGPFNSVCEKFSGNSLHVSCYFG